MAELMSRFLAVLGLLLALCGAGVRPADAYPAQRAAVLSGSPCTGKTASLDFVANSGVGVYCLNGTRYSSPTFIPGWSFTRASTESCQWADGHLTTAPAGVPCMTDLGLGIWESRTNLALRSQDYTNAAWNKNLATATASALSAPDGTTTGQTLTASSGAGFHGAYQAITLSGSTTYAFTAILKQGTSRYAYVNLGSTSGNYITAVCDLQAVSITQTGHGATSGTITSTSAAALSGGWVAVTMVGSLTTVTGSYAEVGIASAATGNTLDGFGQVTFTATGTETLGAWGSDLEAGAFATPYIPTTSASVTRAADVASLSGVTSAAAAFYQTFGVAGGTLPRLFQYDGGANAYFVSSTGVELTNNTVTLDGTIGGAGTQSGVVKTALGFDATGMSVIANGGTKATNASAWAANTGNLTLGNNSGGTRALNGYLQRVLLGPTKGQFDGATQ